MKETRSRQVFAKRSLGQNFLVDRSVIARIIAALEIRPGETIVEIGPGRGALTRELVRKGERVIALEFDRELAVSLAREFGDNPNVSVVECDALDFDFRRLGSHGQPKLKLVANLPYNISTAILQRMVEAREEFSLMVLMFQREVVERITAEPGSSDRGYLTVITEAYFQIERLFDVGPEAFRPEPKVRSSVVCVRPRDVGPPIRGNESIFDQLASAGFRQKRKTLLNNFRTARSGLPLPDDLGAWLTSCGIDQKRRAESLTLQEWKCLLDKLLQT